MKMIYYPLEMSFDLLNGNTNSLVIESPILFEKFLVDIERHFNKEAEIFALYEEEKGKNLIKSGDFIVSPFDLRFDKKEIQKKLYAELGCFAEETDVISELCRIHGLELEVLDQLFFESGYELIYKEEFVLADLFKKTEVQIKNPEGTFSEKLLEYITTTARLLGKDFFLIANCDAYLGETDYGYIRECAQHYNLCIVFLRNRQLELHKGEKEYIIDRDLCEIH